MLNPLRWMLGAGALVLLTVPALAADSGAADEGKRGDAVAQAERPSGGFPRWDGRSGSYGRGWRKDAPDAPRDVKAPAPGDAPAVDRRGGPPWLRFGDRKETPRGPDSAAKGGDRPQPPWARWNDRSGDTRGWRG